KGRGEGLDGDVLPVPLDLPGQRGLALTGEERRVRDLAQVEALGIRPAGTTARTSLAARLDVGRGGERRSRRGGAARPENVVTKAHGEPPHEPELVPGAAGSARATRG